MDFDPSDVAVQSAEQPAYGAMRAVMADHVYVTDATSRIFTTPCLNAHVSTPFDVLICITACRQRFKLRVVENVAEGNALVAAARDRSLHANGVQLVLVQLTPFHPDYRLFRRATAPVQLDRERFAEFDTELVDAYFGRLSLDRAQAMCRGVIAEAVRGLPALAPLDARVADAMQLLFDNPRLPLEELAAHNSLSYDRMSHLFIDQLGISIRSFQVWVKLLRALRGIQYGRSLIELAELAGFSDAAHLSRVYKQVFGAPPSYFYFSGNVKLVASFAGPVPGTPESVDERSAQIPHEFESHATQGNEKRDTKLQISSLALSSRLTLPTSRSVR